MAGNLDPVDTSLNILTYVLCAISILCLLVTITIILYFKKLRTKIFQQIVLQLAVLLILVMLLVTVGLDGDRVNSEAGCTAIALLLHLALLTLFCVRVVAGVQLYLKIIVVHSNERPLQIAYIIAYTLPAAIVLATASATKLEAYGNNRWCFLHGNGPFFGGLVAPLALMLLINCVVSTTIVTRMRRRNRKGNGRNERAVGGQRDVNLLYITISLSSVMGLAWLTGIALVINYHTVLQFLYVIFNCSQGIVLFVFHSWKSKDVRKEIANLKKTICAGSGRRQSATPSNTEQQTANQFRDLSHWFKQRISSPSSADTSM